MSGDYTRFTFDPLRDFSRVRSQQGRVLLDADVNEAIDVLDHRLRALALDVLGPVTAPKDFAAGTTPPVATGFEIRAGGPSITIGVGRLYLHGLDLDNHGLKPSNVEAGLKDLRDTDPTPYEQQPYYPNPPAFGSGPRVVYVDAWDREVTAVEDARLVDSGVGVDTAARMQTVWQVKALPARGKDVTCDIPDDEIPGYADATAPSAARLTTDAVGVPAATDPCSVPADGGYRGWDNRLYRVEIHDEGTLKKATFKWSRDNASIATPVTGIDSTRTVLTVTRTGRDDVQRIRENAWVEVLDDVRELSGTPGFLAQVVTVDAVDDITQTVTLSAAVPADIDPLTAANRTRVRQWDHTTTTATLKVADTTGGLVLESGVQVTFTEAVADGPFRTGEYWTFAARSADASVQLLTAAPPQGPVHFYGRLAVVTLPEVQDCRTIWPAECGDDDCGDCTVTVTPESQNTGTFTIQMAIDMVRGTGGTVCLAPGQYRIDEPLRIVRARGVTIRGHGVSTVVTYAGTGSVALGIVDGLGVRITDLALLLAAPPADQRTRRGDRRSGARGEADWQRRFRMNAGPRGAAGDGQPPLLLGVLVARSADVAIDRVQVLDSALLDLAKRPLGDVLGTTWSTHGLAAGETGDVPDVRSIAIAPYGLVAGLLVRDCVLLAGVGVGPAYLFGELTRVAESPGARLLGARTSADPATPYVTLLGCTVANSVVLGTIAGIGFDNRGLLMLTSSIDRCVVAGMLGYGLVWGLHGLNASTTVQDCLLSGPVAGVLLGMSGTTVEGCVVTSAGTRTRSQEGGDGSDGDAVRTLPAQTELAITAVAIRACRLHAARYGVRVDGSVVDATVADCLVDADLGGIVMSPDATGRRLIVARNRVTVSGTAGADSDDRLLAGIWLAGSGQVLLADNTVAGVGAEEPGSARMGLGLESCESAVVHRNEVSGFYSSGRPRFAFGVVSWPTHGHLDVVDNVLVLDPAGAVGPADSFLAITALRIGSLDDQILVGPPGREAGAGKPADSAPWRFARDLLSRGASYGRVGGRLLRITPERVVALDQVTTATTTVRGNRVDVQGMTAAVDVHVDGTLLVNDNTIRHAGVVAQLKFQPLWAVDVSANALVVAGNYVEGPLGAASLVGDNAGTAVTGNVTAGEIQLNGALLDPPWAPVNARIR